MYDNGRLVPKQSKRKEIKMRVCLIVPPSLILAKERTFNHLGILSIAGVLERVGFSVDFLDLSDVKNYTQAVSEYMSESDVSTFGLTATTPQLPASVEILNTIKGRRNASRVILGGPHVTMVHSAKKSELLRREAHGRGQRAFEKLQKIFDVLISGDGELAMLEVLRNPHITFLDGSDARGEYYLQKGLFREMPFPARHLIDMNSYNYSIDGVRATTIFTQAGCPFPCGFCSGRGVDSYRRVRLRTEGSVLEEIRYIHLTYGYRGFMWFNDELNVDRNLVANMNSIAKLGEKLGVEWRMRGFVKAELFTKEQAEVMYRAGFREILVGFESGSDLILKNIRKKATRDDNNRCLEIARKAGLRVKALMSIGHPGESQKTIQETEGFLLLARPEAFDLARITVYPGSPYFNEAQKSDRIEDVWTYTVNGHSIHSYEVDYTKDFLFYKGRHSVSEEFNRFYAFTDHLSAPELTHIKMELENSLRQKLGQPYPVDALGIEFEHSMGMGLPDNILRRTT